MIIYIDVLVLLNFYINYLLIRGTCIFMHRNTTTTRIIIGAAVGGLASAIILLPNLGVIISNLIKVLVALIIVAVVFGTKNRKDFMLNFLIFFIISFIFAGLMLGVEMFLTPTDLYVNNGAVYYEISLMVILISTVVAYIIVRVLRFFLDTKSALDKKYTVAIKSKTGVVELSALADSGNKLTDSFSGLPVMVCNFAHVVEILPVGVANYLKGGTVTEESKLEGFRLIPSSTVMGSGLIPAFKPMEAIIKSMDKEKKVDVLIGVVEEEVFSPEYSCIFNPKLVI